MKTRIHVHFTDTRSLALSPVLELSVSTAPAGEEVQVYTENMKRGIKVIDVMTLVIKNSHHQVTNFTVKGQTCFQRNHFWLMLLTHLCHALSLLPQKEKKRKEEKKKTTRRKLCQISSDSSMWASHNLQFMFFWVIWWDNRALYGRTRWDREFILYFFFFFPELQFLLNFFLALNDQQ